VVVLAAIQHLPIGSSTFLNVITKVDNSKGGTAKPSDFTISVSGKSPSPKSFSGSSSGTSVTLKAGRYKVTGSGPTGYTTKYSSGCSGTASGGTPIKCTISASFSQSSPSPSPSGNNSTSPVAKKNVTAGAGDDCKYSSIGCMYITIKGEIKRSGRSSDPSYCPQVDHHKVTVQGYYILNGRKDLYSEEHSFTPTNAGTTIAIGIFVGPSAGYHITAQCIPAQSCSNTGNFGYQTAYLYGGTGSCAGTGGKQDSYAAIDTCDSALTTTTNHQTVSIAFYWKCRLSSC
jgi:Prealbumin-like fold domain